MSIREFLTTHGLEQLKTPEGDFLVDAREIEYEKIRVDSSLISTESTWETLDGFTALIDSTERYKPCFLVFDNKEIKSNLKELQMVLIVAKKSACLVRIDDVDEENPEKVLRYREISQYQRLKGVERVPETPKGIPLGKPKRVEGPRGVKIPSSARGREDHLYVPKGILGRYGDETKVKVYFLDAFIYLVWK